MRKNVTHPPFASPLVRMPKLETDIKRLIVDWLNAQPGVYVWVQNTGKELKSYTKKDGTTKKRLVRYGQVGQADITGVRYRQIDVGEGPYSLVSIGQRIEIEVKRPGKEPNAEQREWLLGMESRGVIAFYADSLEMCQEKWRKVR